MQIRLTSVGQSRLFGLGLLLTCMAYITGASPALDGGDSGEFIAASYTLGISHAPGYPLIALLFKLVQIVVPFGSIAYRCHVASAIIACTLLGLVFVFLRSTSTAVSFFVALFLATRPLFIEQARVAEVFLLNAFLAVAIVGALKKDQMPLAAFLFGLGLTNHQTIICVVPLFLWNAWRRPVAAREWILTLVAGLLGLSVYIYLPIRAHATPPVNFGDPETWSRLWAVITRKEFGSFSLHPSAVPFRNGVLAYQQIVAFLHRMWLQLGWGGTVLCGMGLLIGLMQRTTRTVTMVVFVGWIVCGLGFDLLANLSPYSDIGQWRLERFMLLPLLFSCFGIALVVKSIQELSRKTLRWLAVLGLCVCLTPSVWSAATISEFRWNLTFRDFALSILRSAPFHTRLIIDRILFDEPTSALLIATQVEQKRPDVEFYYRPGTLFSPVYGKDILELSWEERFRRQFQVERALLATPGPVRCLAFDKKNTPFEKPVLDGLLYSDQPSTGNAAFVVWRVQRTHDYPTRLIEAHTPYFVAKAELDANYVDQAIRWFSRAVACGFDMAWLHSNIGGLFAQRDMLLPARWYFEKAARLDPYFYEGPFGVGFVNLKEERWDDAINAFRQAVRVDPSRSDGWYMLGVADYQSQRMGDAREAWQRYLELDPQGPMAETVRKKLQE